MRLVECVPNFSEGRDARIIDAITSAALSVDGVRVLDVDMGHDTNRTVVTMVGSPETIGDGVFAAMREAARLIDMSKHKGTHPRIGAIDVCPFIPVSEISMEECITIAESLGERVTQELGIPVYLYEYAARNERRCNLATIREGEYEGLAEKLKQPEWAPDFGHAEMNARSGAAVIGAREFLIAYNINLSTRNKKIADDIAFDIREIGRARRDINGKLLFDENGEKIFDPGKFKAVKAIGWYIESFGCAQISINFTNYKISSLHQVFDEVCRLAEARGVRVTGSELVGLIPLQAIKDAGIHYLKKQNQSIAVPEKEIIDIAIRSLGLNDLYPFDTTKKIIEYIIRKPQSELLSEKKLNDFIDELSSDSPAPGGGSIAALNGAIASALGAMVANLTHGKKGYEPNWSSIAETGFWLQTQKKMFLDDIDRDTDSFNDVMAAIRLPKKTENERQSRHKAMQQAYLHATLIPFEVMNRAFSMIDSLALIIEQGNQNSLSDAGVAALNLQTALESAFMNILINLPSLENSNLVNDLKTEATTLKEEAIHRIEALKRKIYSRLMPS